LQDAQAKEPGAAWDDIPTIKIKAALFEQVALHNPPLMPCHFATANAFLVLALYLPEQARLHDAKLNQAMLTTAFLIPAPPTNLHKSQFPLTSPYRSPNAL
jgi:hypothetical protein